MTQPTVLSGEESPLLQKQSTAHGRGNNQLGGSPCCPLITAGIPESSGDDGKRGNEPV